MATTDMDLCPPPDMPPDAPPRWDWTSQRGQDWAARPPPSVKQDLSRGQTSRHLSPCRLALGPSSWTQEYAFCHHHLARTLTATEQERASSCILPLEKYLPYLGFPSEHPMHVCPLAEVSGTSVSLT